MVQVEHNVECALRDGTVLRADVYRPDQRGPAPVLVHRTPYDKSLAQQVVYHHPQWWARRGYLVVSQDVRGRYASDGQFEPYLNEGSDTFDTVQWASTLPGSNGRVGMYGFSYAGALQLAGAALRPPALRCIAPACTSDDFYTDWTYTGGALNLAFVVSWVYQMLAGPDLIRGGRRDLAEQVLDAQTRIPAMFRHRPLRTLPPLESLGELPYLSEWLDHSTRDEYWKARAIAIDQIDVPALFVGGWYDTFIEGLIRAWRTAGASTGRHQLLVGPWAHAPWGPRVGCRYFGPDAGGVVDSAQLAWFDQHLRGIEPHPTSAPAVRTFVMGRNQWTSGASWPPLDAIVQPWYLHSLNGANSIGGDGTLDQSEPGGEEPDVYVSMPARPVPSAGGRASNDPDVVPMGPAHQDCVEGRNDVLVYTGSVLSSDLHVEGTVWCELYAATDGPDCDWNVKLVDVDADGIGVNVCAGVLRARFRSGFDAPEAVTPDAVHRFRIRVGSTAVVFRTGHRIRLQVSSTDFPQYDANPQTGAVAALAGPFELRPATQAVFHDADRPSVLLLPVCRDGNRG